MKSYWHWSFSFFVFCSTAVYEYIYVQVFNFPYLITWLLHMQEAKYEINLWVWLATWFGYFAHSAYFLPQEKYLFIKQFLLAMNKTLLSSIIKK